MSRLDPTTSRASADIVRLTADEHYPVGKEEAQP